MDPDISARRGARARAAGAVVVCLALAASAVGPLVPRASASAPPLVALDAGAQGPRVAALLEQELVALRSVRVTAAARARFVVRATRALVVRGAGDVRCDVSLVVEDSRGVVRAVLSGRTRASGDRPTDELEALAIRRAIRSALRPLPDALRARHPTEARPRGRGLR